MGDFEPILSQFWPILSPKEVVPKEVVPNLSVLLRRNSHKCLLPAKCQLFEYSSPDESYSIGFYKICGLNIASLPFGFRLNIKVGFEIKV